MGEGIGLLVTGAARPSVGRASRLHYGVGMRVLTDRHLLRQIREEIVQNHMDPADIARLENVTAEELVALLDLRLAGDAASGAQLRTQAAVIGLPVGAWRTSRGHASKLHALLSGGTTLCGTPRGAEPVPVHAV